MSGPDDTTPAGEPLPDPAPLIAETGRGSMQREIARLIAESTAYRSLLVDVEAALHSPRYHAQQVADVRKVFEHARRDGTITWEKP